MHKTGTQAREYARRFSELAASIPSDVDLLLCPPFTAIASAAAALDRSRVALGAQDVFWEESGAFTGEIAVPMLRDLGVTHVIVGHSERRQYFGDTDQTVRRKTAAALAGGLQPIVAVGESLEIRESGEAIGFVVEQTRAALEGLTEDAIARIAIAYEPVWAIGTGRSCDPLAAGEVMGAIRACSAALRTVPILYGGSVSAENIARYAEQPEIDGALVGGASLDPDGFARLAAALSRTVPSS